MMFPDVSWRIHATREDVPLGLLVCFPRGHTRDFYTTHAQLLNVYFPGV